MIGIISVDRMNTKMPVRPRNSYLLSANAHIALTTSVMMVATTVTNTLLARYRPKLNCRNGST